MIILLPPLLLLFNGRFSGWTRVSQFRQILQLFWKRTSVDWGNGIFYGPYVLPVTRPSVSKQWKEHSINCNHWPDLILSLSIHHCTPDRWSLAAFTPALHR